jgi:hypothetical protein
LFKFCDTKAQRNHANPRALDDRQLVTDTPPKLIFCENDFGPDRIAADGN